MAVPIVLQVMWLLLVSAASAGLVTRSVQREFPQLAHVIYSICGLKDLDISVSHPCAFSIFGMAYAFTECGAVHHADYQHFKPCILSCTTDDRCARACADPEVKNPNCLSSCQVVAKCIKEVADQPQVHGHTSAKDELSQCFSAEPTAPPPPTVIISQNNVAESPAAPPAAALLATQSAVGAAPALAPPPLVASPAPAAVTEAFSVRTGTVSERRGLVADECACSKTGIVRATDTGQPGCAKHQKERNAYMEAYCYVEGDFKCGGAMSSDIYPGLFWVSCEKPNLHILYPPQCEILQRSQPNLFAVPDPLGLRVPPGNLDEFTPDMAPLGNEGNPSEDMSRDLMSWQQPLPPIWHASHDNYFANEAFQSGPVIQVSGVAASHDVPPALAPAPAIAPAAAFLQEHPARLRGVQQH